MYISKFSAFNYRSLKQVVIRLEQGKNVIVGKNNSGKSNIIKGIELLVGERFPTNQTFSENDFYTIEKVDEDTGELNEHISENFYLEAELSERDFDEELILSIKKSTAFSKVQSSTFLYCLGADGVSVDVNFDFFQGLDELEHKDGIDEIPNRGVKVIWYKALPLLTFLKSCKTIKIFFCKSRNDEDKVGHGLICIDGHGHIYMTHFLSKKLRDSLITTTVISALRSHKEDLRMVNYTWFGKLVFGLWNKNKLNIDAISNDSFENQIKLRSLEIKTLVDQVFHSDTSTIRKLLQEAIAHKSVSFKFMQDGKGEMHKNVKLFVNDGIDRPLHEKGTGIQSAIIISLFSLYCDEYHNTSSLLITEEPELFLHPQAKRVISSELDKFLVSSIIQKRQLIISTHSTEFLKDVEPYNIIRVHKDPKNNCSVTSQLGLAVSNKLTIELKRFLWSNNSELFFSDKVILVEGGEVYLIPAIVDKVKNSNQVLDYKNISVARVNGKGSFLTYVKMLECFQIAYVILGDMDCFKDEAGKFVIHKQLTEIQPFINKVKAAIKSLPVDYDKIRDTVKSVPKSIDAQTLKGLFERILSGELPSGDVHLKAVVEMMQSKSVSGDKYSIIVEKMGKEDYKQTHSLLRQNNMFLWEKGDLESCYTIETETLTNGLTKDTKALQLSYFIKSPEYSLDQLFINSDELIDLVDLILI